MKPVLLLMQWVSKRSTLLELGFAASSLNLTNDFSPQSKNMPLLKTQREGLVG